MPRRYRLAILASHPIQYHVPLFRSIATRREIDLTVYFCSDRGLREYWDFGFHKRIRWDIPLLIGYKHRFLRNFSPAPSSNRFFGLINPGIVCELMRQHFDAILIPGYTLASFWLGYIGAWMSRTPVLFRGETVLRPHRAWWIRALKRLILSLLFHGTAAFLPIGSQSRCFYKAFGISENRLFFSPYSVDNDFFTKESSRWLPHKEELKSSLGLGGRPVVLFVGALVGRKRPQDLLSAYETVRAEADLVFVGDGPLRPRLERDVRMRSFSRVVFTGFQNQSVLPRYYALADIFVLPSSSAEVSPLVINEAMCCGLPIVVSDAVPSCADLVRPGINGAIYPCKETRQLGKILQQWTRDEALRRNMGARSLEMIARWGIPEAADGIVRALRSLSAVRET